MAQPAETTGWDSGNNNVLEPSGTKKALGWVTNEKPASSYFNWLFITIEAWLVWVQGIYGYATTWTGSQTFNGPVNIQDGLALGTPNPLVPANNPNGLSSNSATIQNNFSGLATIATLPGGATPVGTIFIFNNLGTGSFQILPSGVGGTLNGANTATGITLSSQYSTLRVFYDGANTWFTW